MTGTTAAYAFNIADKKERFVKTTTYDLNMTDQLTLDDLRQFVDNLDECVDSAKVYLLAGNLKVSYQE
jgi:hypothetical protein